MAQILVRQLKNAGVDEVVICLGYLSDLITAFFGDGKQSGLSIRYSYESTPLGTAGPLAKVKDLAEDFLVVNADEFTTLNFLDLYTFHQAAGPAMTVAVQSKPIKHNFGVMKIRGGKVFGYKEKPSFNHWVSMGIYVLNRRVVELIPADTKFDMPDLVNSLLDRKEKVISYMSEDLWIDIGTLEDLRKAQEMASSLGPELLKLE